MGFLSQGDFMFPFDVGLYWAKHFFTWSYQTGAVNMDGIIRLPSRGLNILVFALTGNIAVGYFYIFFSLALIFWSFYLFAAQFLDIKDRRIRTLGALFFTLNPIFLGYIAKIGLMVGVAMLPLCLVVLDLAFRKRQFRYFIIFVLLLNVSLIHPFTLTVNLAVSGIYLLRRLRRNGGFIWKQKAKTLGTLLLCLALNAYFLLPVAGLGTVSKSVLSEDISKEPVDYTALVDFANTGDPLTALSLSRDVLLDFDYYDFTYGPIYFGAVFVFYLVLLGLYIYNEKSLSKRDRERLALLFGIFLILLLLSMATFFEVNRLIKMAVGLPGGWMFRSPLKWQLYIPLVLSTIFSLLLHKTAIKKIRTVSAVVGVVTLLLMGTFLSVDIYRKLLLPRQFQYLGGMQAIDMDQRNLLFISDSGCFSFLHDNPVVVTEMNQIFTSKNTQVKRIKAGDVDSVNLGSYDFIFGCRDTLTYPLQDEVRFDRAGSFAEGAMELYRNTRSRPYIFANDQIFRLGSPQNIGDKYAFADKRGQDFNFLDDAAGTPATGLYDPFEGITVDDVQDSKIVTQVPLAGSGNTRIFANADDAPGYYKLEASRINFSRHPLVGFVPIERGQIEIPAVEELEAVYHEPGQTRENLIANPSFEDGPWQEKVWDCYAYDDKPSVSMSLNGKQAAEGRKSLELGAKRHIACTGPPETKVTPGERYLLNFRYRAEKSSFAGYRVSFDNIASTTLSDSLPAKGGDWQELTKEIEVPEGATKLQLTLHAYPGNAESGSKVLFDDFTLMKIPDLQGKLYITSPPETTPQKPAEVSYDDINPTEKRVHVRGARTPFFLAMRDSYNPQWQLLLGSTQVKDHVKLDGFMNGWYVDPLELCRANPAGCTRNGDGSYDLEMAASFAPQRWFYIGLMISGAAFMAVIGYFIYVAFRMSRDGRRRYWRWES